MYHIWPPLYLFLRHTRRHPAPLIFYILSLVLMGVISAVSAYSLDTLMQSASSVQRIDLHPYRIEGGVSPLLVQYDGRSVDPGVCQSQAEWGLLGVLGTGYDCGAPRFLTRVVSNESTAISTLENIMYTSAQYQAAVQIGSYVSCKDLDLTIVLGKTSKAGAAVYQIFHDAFVQNCKDETAFGEVMLPLTIDVYALPQALDMGSMSFVSLFFVRTILSLNPIFSLSSFLDPVVSARISGQKLIMHGNGLGPYTYHLAHYFIIFVLTFISLLVSYLATYVTGTGWAQLNMLVSILCIFSASLEIATIGFALCYFFKRRETFRNSFPNLLLLLFYVPSFVSSFVGEAIPFYIDLALTIFPTTLLTKLYATLAYYGVHSRGKGSVLDMGEALLTRGLIWYCLTTCLYALLGSLLLYLFDKPFAHHYRKRRPLRDEEEVGLLERQEIYPESGVFMHGVQQEIEAVKEELQNQRFTNYQEAFGRVLIDELHVIYTTEKRCRGKKNTVHAVRGISLRLTPDEESNIVCIVGPNGCGKTSLFRSIILHNDFTGGDVYLNGHSVVQASSSLRLHLVASVGICFQDDALLFKTLTVQENLRFYHMLSMLNKCRSDPDWNVLHMVINDDFLGLREFLNVKADVLSGGWRRRLSVACSLCNNPSILLLDEPTSGLDIQARTQLWEIICDLSKNRTVLVSTHSLEEADTYCKKIVFMNGGRLVSVGHPARIRAMNTGQVLVSVKYDDPHAPDSLKLHTYLEGLEANSLNQITLNSSVRYYSYTSAGMDSKSLFARLLKAKQDAHINDFTITQPSLEQTYLSLMKHVDEVMPIQDS
ncbi:ABC transporter family protein [Giardia muris]|uniref:ABC transporter family protein n=1 Tax=Giardia muris TaxID=5742 RepID=A0A4Z1T6I8_GIAMU|nr:ABC transporter family protein [Giardia muris]|eukprot:TNJ28091.1 ABC transporter family protein [Giardia muris]